MKTPLDEIQLNFSSDSLLVLNISLALIMFGVAINLTIDDFKAIFKRPRSVIAGLLSQFVALPLFTYLLIIAIKPMPSMALGMMMIAACPGGNISNFFSLWAKADVALSVSLTGISTLLSLVFTPLNFTFWASMYEPTNSILQSIEMDLLDILKTVFLILIIPLILGMIFRHYKPNISKKLESPLQTVSLVIFVGFVVIAFYKNRDFFVDYIADIAGIVFFHNLLALAGGFLLGTLFRLPFDQKKTLSIETGIQNSGLGLVLIFGYFGGLGGMAIIAAWWGVWHIVAGITLGYIWGRKKSHIHPPTSVA